MTNPELKPCPFCGGEKLKFRKSYITDSIKVPPVVGCQHCGFNIAGEIYEVLDNNTLSEQQSDEALIAWWNKRACEK